jgi:WD40 repeat protein
MSDPQRCERCGGPLVQAGALDGSCPKCMAELGFESTFDVQDPEATSSGLGATSTSQRPAMIGRYKILRLIGEGGMGTVYEAEQEHPRRMVALKIIKPGRTSPELLHRFEQESQALGRLQHPGIAQIYEAGTADTGFGPQPYFAMELVHGEMPRAYVQKRNLKVRDQLELVAKVADAVHHAHLRGLIHRDLKPTNILVDETGQPKVLDFGVARVTDREADSTLHTDIGQLVGTLAYMSPEQVSGDPLEIDIRTDVYALGVILYELLAGHLPYNTRGNLPEVIRAIREEDAAPLTTIHRMFKGDIETIAIKALEKDKTRRYASAAELAADIRRYLKDEPIVARPPSASYQLRKFARRHRTLVAGVAAAFVFLIAGVVATTWQAVRATRAELVAVQAEEQAQLGRDSAEQAGRTATRERDRALEAERESRRDRDRADAEATIARTQRLITVFQSLARESVRDSTSRLDDDRAALLARQAMLFQSRLPSQAQYLVEDALQQAVRLAPVNHNMLPGDRREFRTVAYSPDGAYLAAGGDDTVRLWNLRNPGTLPRLFPSQDPQYHFTITSVAFSPDSAALAVGRSSQDGEVQIWDLRNLNAPPRTLSYPMQLQGFVPNGGVLSLAFSPDGTHLISGGGDSKGVAVWDLRKPNVSSMLLKSPANVAAVTSVAFSPTDETLVAAASGDAVWIWDLKNPGAVLMSFQAPAAQTAANRAGTPPQPGNNNQAFRFNGVFQAVAFSPDGAHIAAGGFAAPQVWDLRNPQAPPLQMPTSGAVFGRFDSITYSRNGTGLAAGNGRTLWVWDLRTPNGRPAQLQADSTINSVAYSPDSARLATATLNTTQIWDMGTAGQPGVNGPQGFSSRDRAAYSADGRRVAVVKGANLRVWDPSNPGTPPVLVLSLQSRDLSLARSQNEAPSCLLPCLPMLSLELSPDGTRLAASSSTELWLWDLRNPSDKPVLLKRVTAIGTVLAFSHDGARLAASSELEHTVWIWNLRDLRAEPTPIRTLQGVASSLAFSPDGARLAAGTYRTVQVWDPRHPEIPPREFPVEDSGPSSLAFSPDGTRLAAAGARTVRILDSRNLSVLAVLDSELGVRSLAFSPDGTRVAASMGPRTQMWDLRKPDSAPLSFQDPFPGILGVTIAFSGDGSRLTLGKLDGGVQSWPLWSAAADYLCTRVWRNLTMDEWRLYIGENIPYERTCPSLPAGTGARN